MSTETKLATEIASGLTMEVYLDVDPEAVWRFLADRQSRAGIQPSNRQNGLVAAPVQVHRARVFFRMRRCPSQTRNPVSKLVARFSFKPSTSAMQTATLSSSETVWPSRRRKTSGSAGE